MWNVPISPVNDISVSERLVRICKDRRKAYSTFTSHNSMHVFTHHATFFLSDMGNQFTERHFFLTCTTKIAYASRLSVCTFVHVSRHSCLQVSIRTAFIGIGTVAQELIEYTCQQTFRKLITLIDCWRTANGTTVYLQVIRHCYIEPIITDISSLDGELCLPDWHIAYI
jgi:FlaA1/EpsC-like NDP-sugar epimerase